MDGLKDADPQVRVAVIQALGELGSDAEDALPELKRLQQRDESPLVRQSVAPVLEKIRNGSARSNVRHYLLLVAIAAGAAAGVVCVRRFQQSPGKADSGRPVTSDFRMPRRVQTETLTNTKKAGQS